MSADPLDIAKYTNDGVTVTFQDLALKATHPHAKDLGEINTFFRYEADAQAMLNERSALQAQVGVLHETIEVDEALGVGSALPITPQVPTFRVVDETRGLDALARTMAVSFDMTVDRYSLEVTG
jgi:hypothetical protein